MKNDIKNGIISGALSGAVWGIAALAVNRITGISGFEAGLLHNLVSFLAGGVIFGLLAGTFLAAAGGGIPVRGAVTKAVVITVMIWLVLRAGGAALSVMDSERYHVLTPEAFQGLGLSIMLGIILGIFWGRLEKRSGESD